MTYYVYTVTTEKKLITWKCSCRDEARIVMSNLSRSRLLTNLLILDISMCREQPWLKRGNYYDSEQHITIQDNESYYYPAVFGIRRAS